MTSVPPGLDAMSNRHSISNLVLSALAAFVLGAGCDRSREASRADQRAAESAPSRPPGGLPAGCATVVALRPQSLGPVGDALVESLARIGLRGGTLPGSFGRDVTEVKYCKFGSRKTVGDFVLVLSGRIPRDALETLGSSAPGVVRARVGGLNALGREGVWAVERPVAGGNELVLASDQGLLRTAVSEPPASYRIDTESALSGFMSGDEIGRWTRSDPATGASGFEAVQAVVWTLGPEQRALTARFVVRDRAQAEPLRKALQPVLGAIVKHMTAGDSGPPADVTTSVVDDDVVSRVALPARTLDVLAARIAGAAPRRDRRP
jgi:hypothetical protein